MTFQHVCVAAAFVTVGCSGLDGDMQRSKLSGTDPACLAPKVTLCHVPPGDPADARTVCVGANAEDAHLAHGDSPGACATECAAEGDTCAADSDCCDGLACEGGVCVPACTPTAEVCGDAIDNDCDGEVDEGCLGDRAWQELDGDGIQDPDEPGFAGATFILRTSLGAVVAVTVSDVNGNYYFSGVAPGAYIIQVMLPVGSIPTVMNAGPDDVDSDFDPETGETAPFEFTGAANYTIDCGVESLPAL